MNSYPRTDTVCNVNHESRYDTARAPASHQAPNQPLWVGLPNHCHCQSTGMLWMCMNVTREASPWPLAKQPYPRPWEMGNTENVIGSGRGCDIPIRIILKYSSGFSPDTCIRLLGEWEDTEYSDCLVLNPGNGGCCTHGFGE
jgi:hypothetical protein